MRIVPSSITDAWESEDQLGGDKRPTVRATIHVTRMRRFSYDTSNAVGGNLEYDRKRRGNFSTIIFGDDTGGVEIRNIKQVQWTRSVNSDVAEMTLTCLNTELSPIGNTEEQGIEGEFDHPGYMTPTRGGSILGELTEPNPWGYDDIETGWTGRIAPDRIIKTYEGYGCDPTAVPADDTNLLQSGTWIIDEASFDSDGNIEIRCRDIGRLLLDQIVIPPVVPYEEYPLSWQKIHTEVVTGRAAQGGNWKRLTGNLGTSSSSNAKYVGEGPDGYVGNNSSVRGHHHSHVLLDQDDQYWLSTGQSSPWSVVWWNYAFNNARPINAVRFTPQAGPYRVYISLKTAAGWVGRRQIPYDVTTLDVDVNADIPFVATTIAEKNRPIDVTLKKVYGGVKEIRLTFTKLSDSERINYPFNAGLRNVEVYTAPTKGLLSFGRDDKTRTVGNYSDYTDIVKWVCAWGGFFWPSEGSGMDFIRWGQMRHYFHYLAPDTEVLPKGRVWGDFMDSGTTGQYPGGDLTPDLFDKQPLMDVINYIRDNLGFVFFIDETGGVVWRMPNWQKKGNYLSPAHNEVRSRSRTNDVITLYDDQHILSYGTTLDGKNQRERLFVGDAQGKKGVAIEGFTAYSVGFRRVAGWTDQHFESYKEMRVMADMIATRQMFDYRRSRLTIAANPAIQIDDQIEIFERVTNETFHHYVESISSSLSMETGEWTYDLETHWLGEDPDGAWVIKPDKLDLATRQYLDALYGGGG